MSDASDFVAESKGLPKVLGRDDGISLNLSWRETEDVSSVPGTINERIEGEWYSLVDKHLEGVEL